MSDFLISPAYAQAAGGAGGGLGGMYQLLPYALVFVIFYFMMIRPQQQKQKKLKESLQNMRRGDRIVTSGGIIGVVRKASPEMDEIDVEIAPNVTVKVLRSTVSTVLSSVEKPANDTGASVGKA
ncbi:preprotein translocase subunit YajC [Acetobacter sp.]|jgi:preprotein translocase subunit YajC|uniref:preprotein translocase subunit YajC n=1 Tax=Acetobacter sp. TaxID=440 RepID=UPI0025B9BE44|nr:preprotein translocase subunit YajC [Acetobacter sp.]MCH4090292.1 preprotein translocase subunit YajC [Acetobacter sp.]MCI1298986.1 preprotein translocase subunit YajC [Acetobacter sp.]MCI1315006.1 preprotein translocase subunit YajC [Acetobacter sp.]